MPTEPHRAVIPTISYLAQAGEAPHRYEWISDALHEALGLDPREAAGTDQWLERLHPEDQPALQSSLASLAGSGHVVCCYRVRETSGGYVRIQDEINQLPQGGRIVGTWTVLSAVRGIEENTTSRQQAEAERTELLRREQRARAEAEAANLRKDHFLAVLSHELRTPLTPVLARLALLKREPGLPLRIQSGLDMIRRNVELETRIIDDLLDLTKIVQGTLQLSCERVDAHQAIREALAIYQEEIETRELRLTVNLEAQRHEVWADATRLEQVFWNLISNAVKYTPKGGAISIRTRNEPGSGSRVPGPGDDQICSPEPGTPNPMFTVEISDTGIGIEPEVMRRLFNAFEQGEQTLSRRFGGLGLGLTISKTLVDLQGGSLAAFSAGKDQGASFSVRLPAMAIAGEPRPAPTAALPKRAFKILLVEDNEDTQRVLARFLKLAGHEVCTASSVHAAMDAATTSTFDLLLCDIGLPDGTGWDLMQSLRARCPIRGVALTGFASSEDAQKSLAAGFAEHLAKPIIPEKLEAAIQRAAS